MTEIYIVSVEEQDGTIVAHIQRNDGKWYDEHYTDVATVGVPEVSRVIEADIKERHG